MCIEWKPIESAPRDGTQILIQDKFGNKYVAFYQVGEIGHPNDYPWVFFDWHDLDDPINGMRDDPGLLWSEFPK